MRLLRRDRRATRLVAVAVLFLSPSLAATDGGSVRLSEQQGGYSITIFTSPTMVRAGAVDISVLVQDAATGERAAGVQVTVTVTRRGSTAVAFHGPATTEAATNKLYYATVFDLPEPGWYTVEVSIDGVAGNALVHFDLEAAEALPSWLTMVPWLGWPVVAVVLFGIHQVLVRRRSH